MNRDMEESPANLERFTPDFFLRGNARANLAYWVVPLLERRHPALQSATAMADELTSQCDAEDQASVGDDDVWGNAQFIAAVGKPVSPVQFAQNWSPLPLAETLLGKPQRLSVDDRGSYPAVAAVWYACNLSSVEDRTLNSVESRFLDILRASRKESGDLCLVAMRGYSFADRHLNPVAQRALTVAGFKFKDRSPE